MSEFLKPTSGTVISISGVTFKNVSGWYQPISCVNSGGTSAPTTGFVSANSGDMTLAHPSGSITVYGASGDVELESKPSWAIYTE